MAGINGAPFLRALRENKQRDLQWNEKKLCHLSQLITHEICALELPSFITIGSQFFMLPLPLDIGHNYIAS